MQVLKYFANETRQDIIDLVHRNLAARAHAAIDLGMTAAAIVIPELKLGQAVKVAKTLKAAEALKAASIESRASKWGLFGKSAWGEESTIALEEGLHHLDPKTIRFTQPTVSPNFTNGGRVNDLISDLRSGKTSAYDLPSIQVVQKDGKLFSIDNRRLLAFNTAGVEKVLVEIVSINNPKIALKLLERFDPIAGKGDFAIVVNRATRNTSLDLLYEYNLIKGLHHGYQ